jgi:hypothetical protein
LFTTMFDGSVSRLNELSKKKRFIPEPISKVSVIAFLTLKECAIFS